MQFDFKTTIVYHFDFTNEQLALITKALCGKLRDADEQVKAKELGLEILDQRNELLRSKYEASVHAWQKAQE